MIYIYTLAHPDTKEIRYVGKSNDTTIRLSNHLSDKSKTHKVSWIKSLNDNKPILEILDICDDRNWAETEQYWIAQLKSWGFNLVNHTIGGEGSAGIKLSDEHKRKISRSMKATIAENGSWLLGKKQAIQTKLKRSKSLKGRKNTWQKGKVLSDEIKNKMSKAVIGEKNPHSKLTEEIVIGIKLKLKDGYLSQRKIAKIVGVKPYQVFNIAQQKSWKHIKI